MKLILAMATLLLCCTGAWATVPNVPFSVSFACSGSLGPYPFTFPISDPTALMVEINGTLVATTNYTIVAVNNNYANGGSITLTSGYGPCLSGSTLLLLRATPKNQLISFYDNMPIPMSTFGRAVDKLTEISQEIWGETVQSVQMQVSGVNYLGPASGGQVIFNFAGCGVTGTQTGVVPNTVNTYNISCGGGMGGTVTSVTGTANQVDVVNTTTTPTVSLDPAIIVPGTLTMGANLADFHLGTVKLPGGGLLALGTSNQNWGTLGSGFVMNTTTTGALSVVAPTGAKCYPFQGSGGTGCDLGVISAFSSIGSGTNTTAAMVLGSGSSLTFSGSGTNNANEFNGNVKIATADGGTAIDSHASTGIARDDAGTWSLHELSGDVTTSGSNATTVAKIQTNTVSGTTGLGNVVFSTSPTLTTPSLGNASATSISTNKYTTANNCQSAASPAVCGAAPAGMVVIAASATTVVVDTSAVGANSEIFVQEDTSIGSALSVTCNTANVTPTPYISARSAGVSFTITETGTVSANPLCLTYHIMN